MQQQMIYRLKDERVVRVLLLREDRALVIDCEKQTMPIWIENTEEEISFVTFEYPAFSEISEIDKKELIEIAKIKTHRPQ